MIAEQSLRELRRASEGYERMCGIAGFSGAPPDKIDLRVVLNRMIGVLGHRGPDAHGLHVDGGVGLGHTRLSIIDLTGGAQPMTNEDGTIWITFNGEIFNYPEIRQDLLARGHAFRTQSDTETIIHSYEDLGPACVDTFNGDFAFALWDKRRNKLMLARDRMGVRPLYYAVAHGALVFASEVKALLQFPGIHADIDPIALDQCFTFWFPLAPRTPFKGISEIPPGHILLVDRGNISLKQYWRLQYPEAADYGNMAKRTEESLAEELRSLLIDATNIRLRADVPVGAYLSGGLDSSVVTSLIKLSTSTRRLRTFSVTFEDPEFDESRFQQEVVRTLDTDHTALTCTHRDIGAVFPEVIRHTERPILRTAPAPLFQLARLVREHDFKVVLTGEGADEILAGYDIFKEAKVRAFWSRQPQSRLRPLLLRRLYPYMAGMRGQPQAYLQAFYRPGIDQPDDPFFSHRPRWNMTSRAKLLFSGDLRSTLQGYDAVEDLRQQLPGDYFNWDPLSRAQYLETAFLLPGYILSSQGDRVSMAHAVEGRFPFLDVRVVQLCSRMPPRMRLRMLKEKYILRKSMRRFLPPSIADRPKQPYRAPDSQSFLEDPMPAYVVELLSPEHIRRAGYFDADAVDALVRKCRARPFHGARDNMTLVGILSVQLLDHLFVRHSAAVPPVVP